MSNEQAARKLEERWMTQKEVQDKRNWLIREVLTLQSQLESTETELAFEKSARELSDGLRRDFAAQNKLLKDALNKWLAVKWPKECSHGEEPWYCPCCRYDWEKELMAARNNAEAALASIPGPKEDKHA